MQRAIAGQANVLTLPLLKRADGQPLVSGTVAFYLRAKDGTHAGSWWDGAAWQVAATSCGNGTYSSSADWDVSVASGAWTAGVRYRVYAVDSGDVCFDVGDDVLAEVALATIETKTSMIAASAFTVRSHVAADGTITLIAGDDYPAGNELTVTKTNYSGPDLSGAGVTVALKVQTETAYEAAAGGTLVLDATGTISQTDTTVVCSFVLTAAQTGALAPVPPGDPNNHVYQVVASTADDATGKKITLAIGSLEVTRQVATAG